jgi:hypothetical protein
LNGCRVHRLDPTLRRQPLFFAVVVHNLKSKNKINFNFNFNFILTGEVRNKFFFQFNIYLSKQKKIQFKFQFYLNKWMWSGTSEAQKATVQWVRFSARPRWLYRISHLPSFRQKT